jgi:hypothetical protein
MYRTPMIAVAMFLALGATARAQYVQVGLPLEQLPQKHDYQKKLRQFLATLTDKDFDVERKEITVAAAGSDELYRLWLLSLHQHNVSAARLPAAAFTLKAVEGGKGMLLPCAPQECQMLAWLASWDYAGNPYKGSRPLKLRAFVLAAVEIMMLDYLYEHDPQGANRADFLGGNLIWIGRTYQGVKDVLPADALAAFEAGLKKLVLTINKWGPRGAMTDMDLFAPVGLRHIADALDDIEVKKTAESYSRRLFTESRFFHPAGYFVDNGCFDTSYNGISLYFGTWAALMSDWQFAHDAIAKAYRLRAHLSFPHPDGTFSGPSAMASRCSGDPPRDQWQFPPRTYGAAMVTDEAIHQAPLPSDPQLKAAPQAVVANLNKQLAAPRKFKAGPWRESHWSGAINFAYEFYKKGTYERRLQLAKQNSPLLKPLYLRDERFVREFDKAFVVARLGGYAAAIHTGPVAGIHKEWQRPYGFGGGQLSAFWTPTAGPAILARRRGVQGHVFDSFDEWRNWPVHAVTGLSADGGVVSSSRIEQPDVAIRCADNKADVRVAGTIPKYSAAKKEILRTDLRYERHFLVDSDGVKIRTSLKSAGTEKLAELYETIPVFLRESVSQKIPTIHFQVGTGWVEAQPQPQEKVTAIKVGRFKGAVLIAFTHPVTARLSPDVWKDGFQTQAQCRTVLINLLQAANTSVRDVSVEYRIGAPGPGDKQ